MHNDVNFEGLITNDKSMQIEDIKQDSTQIEFKSEYTYSGFIDKQTYQDYSKAYDMLMNSSIDSNTKNVLHEILCEGSYNGFNFSSNHSNTDNIEVEQTRRLSMAMLYLKNPGTFDYIVKNKINLFHGTNFAALPSIIENGMQSLYDANNNGVDITTGEKWSRIDGKPRSFISFTDVLSEAGLYSSLGGDGLGIMIGTSFDDVKSNYTTVHSETPEVGIKSLSTDQIKAVFTSSENVETVKQMLKDTNIDVLAIDSMDNSFARYEDGLIDINFDMIEESVKDVLMESDTVHSILENTSVAFDDSDISALLADANVMDYNNRWRKRDLSSWAHFNFDGMFGYTAIENVMSKVHKVADSYWETFLRGRGCASGTLGFVDGTGNLYLPESANPHTAFHELFHSLSEIIGRQNGIKHYDVDGGEHKVTGIREFYKDGLVTTWANETLTEYLSSKYTDRRIYSSVYGVDNVRLWERLDNAIVSAYGESSSNLLLKSYLTNDTSAIRTFFDTYGKNSYDTFVRTMESFKFPELNGIVNGIEKNVYKSGNSFSLKIKSIFSKK